MAESPDKPDESEDGTLSEGTPQDRTVQPGVSTESVPGAEEWLTLRAASERAGVSVSALRKWYRAGKIQSRLEPGPTGDMRMVLISEVIDRAGQRQALKVTTLDEQPAQPSAPSRSDDVLPIPKDAWNKMVEQLGNLHEAGQQLAEMAAGKAKAETQVEFLRERVTDLLEQLEEARAWQQGTLFSGPPGTGKTATDDPTPGRYLPPDAMNALIEEVKDKADAVSRFSVTGDPSYDDRTDEEKEFLEELRRRERRERAQTGPIRIPSTPAEPEPDHHVVSDEVASFEEIEHVVKGLIEEVRGQEPDELVEQTISEVVEEAASRRPSLRTRRWLRAVRRGRGGN